MGMMGALIVAVAISQIYKRKVVEAFPVAIIIISLFLYPFGLIGNMKIGLYSDFVLILLSAGFILYKLLRKELILSCIFTVETLVLLIVIAFFMFFSLARDFYFTDDLRTWGAMVKNFYYFDKFVDVDMHWAGVGDYPPGSALWLYFLNKTWIVFSDGICIWGNCVLVVALLLPILDKLRSKKKAVVFFTSAVLLLLPVIRCLHTYVALVPDGVLAGCTCFFLYCLMANIEQSNKLYYFAQMLIMAYLGVLKNSGIVFISILVMIFVYVNNQMNQMRRIINKETATLIIIGIASYISWYGLKVFAIAPVLFALLGYLLYLVSLKMQGKISKNIILIGIVCVLILGRLFTILYPDDISFNSFPFKVVVYNIYALFSFELFEANSIGYIVLPYGVSATMILIMYLVSDRIIPREYVGVKHTIFAVFASMVVYNFIILVMQISSIGPGMAYMAHTPDRYMTTWIVVALYMILFSLIHSNTNKLSWLVFLLFLLYIVDFRTTITECINKYNSIGFFALEDAEVELHKGESVFYVDEEPDNPYRDLEFAYVVMPASTNDVETKIGKLSYTSQELASILADRYDYVYLQTIAPDFISRYGDLFKDGENIASGNAYKVIKSNDELILTNVQ